MPETRLEQAIRQAERELRLQAIRLNEAAEAVLRALRGERENRRLQPALLALLAVVERDHRGYVTALSRDPRQYHTLILEAVTARDRTRTAIEISARRDPPRADNTPQREYQLLQTLEQVAQHAAETIRILERAELLRRIEAKDQEKYEL